MAGLAGLGVFFAIWLAWPRGDPKARLSRVVGPTSRSVCLRTRWPYFLVAAGGVLCAWLTNPLFGIAAWVLLSTVMWLGLASRQRSSTGIRRAAVAEACRRLAALLRVGHVPAAALRALEKDIPVMAEVVAVQRIGGDVAPVLRRLGALPGQSGLIELANAWEISERVGASLTVTLDALADRLVAQDAVRQVVSAELAAPRATGRLLAALPAAGVALGYLIGGDPLGFLTRSVPGNVVLVAGVSCACIGVVWTEKIADEDG